MTDGSVRIRGDKELMTKFNQDTRQRGGAEENMQRGGENIHKVSCCFFYFMLKGENVKNRLRCHEMCQDLELVWNHLE